MPLTAWAVADALPVEKVPLLRAKVTVDELVVTTLPNWSSKATSTAG